MRWIMMQQWVSISVHVQDLLSSNSLYPYDIILDVCLKFHQLLLRDMKYILLLLDMGENP